MDVACKTGTTDNDTNVCFVDIHHIMPVLLGMDLTKEKLNYIKYGQQEAFGLI